jgi:Thioredoxin
MTLNATQDERQPDGDAARGGDRSCRGSPAGCLILEYGDHECPYSRQAFRAIQQVEQQLGGNVRFGFRHFPLTGIHPHALAAAAAAEAARQGRFWDMHELLFHRQNELGESDLVRYTAPTRTGCGGVRHRPDQRGRAGADPSRRRQRPGIRPGTGHSHAVHRRRRAPRRLRPAHPAGRADPMTALLAGRTSCPQQRRADASGDSTPGRQAGHGDQVMERVASGYAEPGVVSTARLLLVSPGPARGRVPVRGAVRVRGDGQSRPAMARLAWPCTAGFYSDLTKSGAMATTYSGFRVTGVCQAAG